MFKFFGHEVPPRKKEEEEKENKNLHKIKGTTRRAATTLLAAGMLGVGHGPNPETKKKLSSVDASTGAATEQAPVKKMKEAQEKAQAEIEKNFNLSPTEATEADATKADSLMDSATKENVAPQKKSGKWAKALAVGEEYREKHEAYEALDTAMENLFSSLGVQKLLKICADLGAGKMNELERALGQDNPLEGEWADYAKQEFITEAGLYLDQFMEDSEQAEIVQNFIGKNPAVEKVLSGHLKDIAFHAVNLKKWREAQLREGDGKYLENLRNNPDINR